MTWRRLPENRVVRGAGRYRETATELRVEPPTVRPTTITSDTRNPLSSNSKRIGWSQVPAFARRSRSLSHQLKELERRTPSLFGSGSGSPAARSRTLVPPRGFEPLISTLKGSCPGPLDDGGAARGGSVAKGPAGGDHAGDESVRRLSLNPVRPGGQRPRVRIRTRAPGTGSARRRTTRRPRSRRRLRRRPAGRTARPAPRRRRGSWRWRMRS
jgi:hypothetical protein